MSMKIDIGKAISLSFDWTRLSESWKYVGIIWVLAIASLCVLIGILSLFVFSGLFSQTFFNCLALGYCEESQILADMLGFWTILFIYFAVAIIVGFLIETIGVALCQLFALRSMGVKNAPFNGVKYIRFLVLLIGIELVALFYSFNKTLRIVQWICWVGIGVVLLNIAWVIPTVFGALASSTDYSGVLPALLLVLPWLSFGILIFTPIGLIAIYNSLRMVMGTPIFLNKQVGIIDALRESWAIMEGNLLYFFLAGIVIGFLSVIIVGIATAILSAIINIAFMFAPTSGMYLNYGSLIAGIILAPVSILISAFFIAGVYSMLAGKAAKPAAPVGQ